MDGIVLSTAAFCLWGIEPQKKLDICKHLGFREIEIALSTERMAQAFAMLLVRKQLAVHDFSRISVHTPWHRVSYGENRRSEKILGALGQIAEDVDVKEFIFRETNISDMGALVRRQFPLCIEKSADPCCDEAVKRLPTPVNASLAVNLNHLVRNTFDPVGMIEKHKGRISRVYVSGFSGAGGRMPLISSNQLHLLSLIKHLDVPVVLEGLFTPNCIDDIARERSAVWHCINRAAHKAV